MSKRVEIPIKISSKVLLTNRHACCICQKTHVQLHHIDHNPSNNDPSNIAVLCLDHHDQATMKIGLTRKLGSKEILHYKASWETKCKVDILALSRDRLVFYATVYKNPPRIRELFLKLSQKQRDKAAEILIKQIADEEEMKNIDQGFKWQAVPRGDGETMASINSMQKGELWPSWLPRVGGHSEDSDYPIDRSPPNGMAAFHLFDLYCQILTRALLVTSEAEPLERIIELQDAEAIDSFAGSLVIFRCRAYGKGIHIPDMDKKYPTGRVQFRSKLSGKVYRTIMTLKTRYIFSDTAAEYLRGCRVCGVGLLGGTSREKKEIHIQIIPLLMGVGGFAGANPKGYWKFK